jgi:hypothetical protein
MSIRALNGRALLLRELERAVALESQLHALLSRPREQAELGRHPCAVAWLERVAPRTQAHGVALEKTLERFASASGQRRSVADCPIHIPTTAEPELARDLDGAYALLSAAIASYVVVGILAGVVGDFATVALAQEHSDDADSFLEELDGLTVSLARQEARAGTLA